MINQSQKAKHSSKTQEWYTPLWLIEKVKKVIPLIDVDPGSCEFANLTVGASRFITKEENALSPECRWAEDSTPVSIFMNPPGGKTGNKSNSGLFWQKLMNLRDSGLLKEAIVIGFSLEQLRVTQNYHGLSMGDFLCCVPPSRIKFIDRQGIEAKSPTHSNIIVYVDGTMNNRDRFNHIFKNVGVIMGSYGDV